MSGESLIRLNKSSHLFSKEAKTILKFQCGISTSILFFAFNSLKKEIPILTLTSSFPEFPKDKSAAVFLPESNCAFSFG